jgi:hypothetical protein
MNHPDLLQLKTLLQHHDWYYQYSDDHKAWDKGKNQADEIRRQMDICCGLGLSNEANALYEEHNPSNTQR